MSRYKGIFLLLGLQGEGGPLLGEGGEGGEDGEGILLAICLLDPSPPGQEVRSESVQGVRWPGEQVSRWSGEQVSSGDEENVTKELSSCLTLHSASSPSSSSPSSSPSPWCSPSSPSSNLSSL